MTAENDNQPTKWYKHTLFLILLNIIGGVIGIIAFMSMIFGGGYTLENQTTYVSIATLIGMINGGVFGYTIWVTTDNFPQSRVVLISGIWAIALGGVFITSEYFIFSSLILLPLAFLITLERIRSLSITSTLIEVLLVTVSSGVIVAPLSYLVDDIIVLELALVISLFAYSVTLPRFLQTETKRRYERAQRQQLQNDLSAGLLPEGEYTVGDDGELIPVDDAPNSHTAQS